MSCDSEICEAIRRKLPALMEEFAARRKLPAGEEVYQAVKDLVASVLNDFDAAEIADYCSGILGCRIAEGFQLDQLRKQVEGQFAEFVNGLAAKKVLGPEGKITCSNN